MSDLLIKGGIVLDGTGTPGKPLDLRVSNGRIAEIGAGLQPAGERVIDAAGAIVAPGFIDSHTHFDATIYWDPLLDPMPHHGVTSVVIGNCSLGFAPMRPSDRAGTVEVFSYIEDIPDEAVSESIPWGWESFGEYANYISARKLGLNLLAFVGHSQIRCYVMGEAAWERAATPQEIGEMVAELDKAMQAGAWGLSFSFFDKDRAGRRVPSCLADAAEMDALFAKLGEHGGVFQFVASGDYTETIIKELEWLGGFLGRHNVTGLYNVVVHVATDPERSGRVLACLERLHRQGIRLYGMASPRPFELSLGFEATIAFIGHPAWNELVQAPLQEKRALASDPAWRARARADAENIPNPMFPFTFPQDLRISIVGAPDAQDWVGKTLGDLVAARGGHVADVLADWLLENDFTATFVCAVANKEHKDVARLLTSPYTFVSGSDAGAHLQMFCAAGDPTLLLTRYVRERGDLTLEAAVHALTGRQAELLGLTQRGVLIPGKAADITIFALEELQYGQEFTVNDVPGGRPRLTRAPGGYRYTIVNGVVVQEGGSATGALPAQWLAKAA